MLRAVISNLGLRMHSRGVASLRSNPGIYSIIIRTLYFVVHKMRADGSVALHIVWVPVCVFREVVPYPALFPIFRDHR